MSPPTLRLATPEDVAVIGDLMRRSVEGLSGAFYAPQQQAGAAQFLTHPDLDLIRDGTYYVVEEDGRVVGAGGWSARRKLFTGSTGQEALSATFLDPNTEPAKIRAFFVDPNHARRGIGRLLYQACEQAALRQGFHQLELMATLPGVPFYRSLGFKEIKPVDVELPSGELLPCLRMSKAI